MKILVVDDSNVSRQLLINLLRKKGYETVAARNGKEALEILASEPLDLIISDTLMPKMDGFELCRRVKTNPGTRGIPFVFHSANYVSHEDVEFATKLGAAKYIVKSDDPGRFLRELDEVLATAHPQNGQDKAQPSEERYLREHIERLVEKLEEKIHHLEQAQDQVHITRLKLRELEQLKEDFISILSHELRTPLTIIMGFVDVVRSQLAGPLNGEQSQYLDIVMHSILNLERRVEDLLEFNLIKAGLRQLELQPVPMCELVGHALDGVRPRLEQQGLKLELHLAEPDVVLHVDADVLSQILIRLLDNAIKFTPRGGTITLASGGDADWVILEVSDTGIGIATDNLPVVFDTFRQLERHATRSYGGLGMGLSISKQLIELHGGRIWAVRKGAQGSTFIIALPRRGRVANGHERATRKRRKAV